MAVCKNLKEGKKIIEDYMHLKHISDLALRTQIIADSVIVFGRYDSAPAKTLGVELHLWGMWQGGEQTRCGTCDRYLLI
jgi:hypothetical protein